VVARVVGSILDAGDRRARLLASVRSKTRVDGTLFSLIRSVRRQIQ
jgi:hypothetical protein